MNPDTFRLATALAHLEPAGIIHEELGAENTLLADTLGQSRKVIEFCLAYRVNQAQIGSHIQSQWYMASN